MYVFNVNDDDGDKLLILEDFTFSFKHIFRKIYIRSIFHVTFASRNKTAVNIIVHTNAYVRTHTHTRTYTNNGAHNHTQAQRQNTQMNLNFKCLNCRARVPLTGLTLVIFI